MLDAIVEAGQDMIAVGKIHDIFAGRGMTEFTYTSGNTDGLAKDARNRGPGLYRPVLRESR